MKLAIKAFKVKIEKMGKLMGRLAEVYRPLISCSYPKIALPNIPTIAQPNKLKAGIYLS